jgi:hypothetical protein
MSRMMAAVSQIGGGRPKRVFINKHQPVQVLQQVYRDGETCSQSEKKGEAIQVFLKVRTILVLQRNIIFCS